MYNQPDIIAESNEGVRKIYIEIIKLPVRLRPATFLRLFEGLKHSEIAEQLVQPPGTVRPHVREGLERLQEAMLPWLNEGTWTMNYHFRDDEPLSDTAFSEEEVPLETKRTEGLHWPAEQDKNTEKANLLPSPSQTLQTRLGL